MNNNVETKKQSSLDVIIGDFIGTSQEMLKVYKTIDKVAKTDANVLILGENGTGKELVARALHKASMRSSQVFVSVDLGSITETLFESEMFGHMKGAFTDAKADKAGRLEVGNKGTVFLDEIGNLSFPMQAKMLTVLERREVTRVGSNTPISIDIRLVSATNMPLKQMISEGKYREDLLYRINTVEITIPPLRERGDDIFLLSNFFLKKYSEKYNKKVNLINEGAMQIMKNYNWPGNVRELQHAIERAVILSENKILTEQDFQLINHPNNCEYLEITDYNLEEVEKVIIKKVLIKNSGHITDSAKELGISRTSLYRKMDKYGL